MNQEKQRIKTICCECSALICDGPQPDHKVSHGYCMRCFDTIMAFVNGGDYDREYAKQMQSIDV